MWCLFCLGFFCPALSKAVKTMKKGEKVLLTVKPQCEFVVIGPNWFAYMQLKWKWLSWFPFFWSTDAFGENGRPASGDEGAVPPNATLNIDLELVSWKSVTQIGDDKKVLKKILKEGEGYEHPNDGAVVQGI